MSALTKSAEAQASEIRLAVGQWFDDNFEPCHEKVEIAPTGIAVPSLRNYAGFNQGCRRDPPRWGSSYRPGDALPLRLLVEDRH